MSDTETITMPRALTAENGAKAALMGEFSVRLPMRCPECDVPSALDCEICGGEAEYFHEINVPWTVIKAIYNAAVAHFDAQSSAKRVD